ncbi:unnamed protein product [Mucor hiemalis]
MSAPINNFTASDSPVENVSASSATGVSERIQGAPHDQVLRLEKCVELIFGKLAQYSEISASAPEGYDLAAYRKMHDEVSSNLLRARDSLDNAKKVQGQAPESSPSTRMKKFTDTVPQCLQYFQDVVVSHCLDIGANHVRLLPPLLSPSVRMWFTGFSAKHRQLYQRDPTWVEFYVAIKTKFGHNVDEMRTQSAKEILNITMMPTESLDTFLQRLNSLRRKAGPEVPSNSLIFDHICSIVPPLVSEHLRVQSALEELCRENLDHVLVKVKNVYCELLGVRSYEVSGPPISRTPCGHYLSAPRAPKRVRSSDSDGSSDLHRESNRSKHASIASSSTATANSSSRSTSKTRRNTGKYCTFHKADGHNTSDCRAAARAQQEEEGPVVNNSTDYRKCGAPGWSPSHRRNTATRGLPSSGPHFAGMSVVPGPSPANNLANDIAVAVPSATNAAPIAFSATSVATVPATAVTTVPAAASTLTPTVAALALVALSQEGATAAATTVAADTNVSAPAFFSSGDIEMEEASPALVAQ